MNFEIFARKNGGQFAPVWGGQFGRFTQYTSLKEKIQATYPNEFQTKEDVEDCIGFFHDIGILLWYKKEDKLKDWVILNPKWAVDAVYKIIDDDMIQNQHGIIHFHDFERVWDTEEKEYALHHDILKQMLEVFKIAFAKRSNPKDFIIPTRLASIPSDEIWKDDKSCLRMEYNFEFMPKGMINQISAELSRYIISDEQVWNNGVNFKHGKSTSQAFEDFANKKIIVKAQGNEAIGLMMIIMNAVKDICDGYRGVKPEISIPCPCKECKTHPKPSYFHYESLLLKLEKSEDAKVMCNNSDEVYTVIKLLYDLGLPNPTKDRQDEEARREGKLIKIFLASSNELEQERKSFREFISVENDSLHERGIYIKLIQWEYYLDDITNTRTQDKLNEAVQESDMTVCLFFTKVGKFSEEEFDTAYDKFKADGAPKIYTYFKDAPIQSKDIKEDFNSRLKFQHKLKELGHYHQDYTSDEDLHLRFKRQLDMYLQSKK